MKWKLYIFNYVLTTLLGLLLFILPTGCDNDNQVDTDSDSDSDSDTDTDTDTDTDSDSDTDTDTDTDTDSDTDTDPDCSECEGTVCMSAFTGRVLLSDGTPVAEGMAVQACTTACMMGMTGPDGYIWQIDPDTATAKVGTPANLPNGECATAEKVHFTINLSDYSLTKYAVGITPTAENVDENFVVDIGDHYVFSLPKTGAEYTKAAGASVSLEGITMNIAPGALGEKDSTITVMKMDLDKWDPPFIEDIKEIDALYHFSPYFEPFENTDGEKPHFIEFSFDATLLGWETGDTGNMFMLGDYSPGFLECEEDGASIEQGEFVNCREANYVDGKVVTTTSRLGWIGIKKN